MAPLTSAQRISSPPTDVCAGEPLFLPPSTQTCFFCSIDTLYNNSFSARTWGSFSDLSPVIAALIPRKCARVGAVKSAPLAPLPKLSPQLAGHPSKDSVQERRRMPLASEGFAGKKDRSDTLVVTLPEWSRHRQFHLEGLSLLLSSQSRSMSSLRPLDPSSTGPSPGELRRCVLKK